MNTIILELRQDHHRMARILKLMRHILDLNDGDINPEHSELMRECIEYMAIYPDAVHHPKEDIIFDRLVQRDLSSKVYVDQLRDEHVTLADQCRRLQDMVYAVDHGAVLQREQFLSLAREYIDMQMRHMRIEETSIFPLVEEKLSIPDWKHIIKKSPAGNDPLFDKSNPSHFDVLTTWIEKPQEPVEP